MRGGRLGALGHLPHPYGGELPDPQRADLLLGVDLPHRPVSVLGLRRYVALGDLGRDPCVEQFRQRGLVGDQLAGDRGGTDL